VHVDVGIADFVIRGAITDRRGIVMAMNEPPLPCEMTTSESLSPLIGQSFTVEALRNTSAAKRQAAKPWLVFRSLDPLRALRKPDRRRRDEERPFRSEQKTGNKPKRLLDRKAYTSLQTIGSAVGS
jgi:hypothetical protein